MSTLWVTQQIMKIKREAEPTRWNPRPAGIMRPGSATEAVCTYLQERPGPGWVTRQQIVASTRRTGKAVDWALIFLRAVQAVESSQDPRNARYLRYRATERNKQ